ncbi:MAG: hypothetical protein ACFFA4_05580 [Promethearchaeota archaeon]
MGRKGWQEITIQKELYYKRYKKDILTIRESYSPKHTLGWLLGDPTMTRGLRCLNCNKKLCSKVEDIIMKSICIIFIIAISVYLLFTFVL